MSKTEHDSRIARITALHRLMDLDGDGTLSSDEYLRFGRHCKAFKGESMSEWNAELSDKMLKRMDRNGDGCIQLDEFVAACIAYLPKDQGFDTRLETFTAAAKASRAMSSAAESLPTSKTIALPDNAGSPWTRERTLADSWILRTVGKLVMMPMFLLELGPLNIYWFISLLPCWICVYATQIFFPLLVLLHRMLGMKTGQHPSLSAEMHTITTLAWLGRVMPLNRKRMRFALSFGLQNACMPAPGRVERICVPQRTIRGTLSNGNATKSYYINSGPTLPKGEAPKVLFWVFGGAFVGGSAESSTALASRVAARNGCDTFIPQMRLCPEHTILEAMADAMSGFVHLTQERGIPPQNVMLFGLSSGGGVALSVLQACASDPEQYGTPAGAVLLSPWVDYTSAMDSRAKNTVRDVITTQRVYDCVRPHLASFCGGEGNRRSISPLYQNMAGLPPVYISVSNHEVAVEEGYLLYYALRQAGGEAHVASGDYVPHVYPMLETVGVPESVEAMREAEVWMRSALGAASRG